MNRLKYLFPLLFLVSSCIDDRPLKTYTVNDLLTIEIPMDMDKSDAGIIPERNVYLVGNKNFPVEVGLSYVKKADLAHYGVPYTLDEMYQFFNEEIAINLSEFKFEKPKSTRVDYMEALHGLMSGKQDDKAYILHAVVCEGPFYFFSYYAIAKEKDFKKHKELINDMLFSVEEYRDFEAREVGN